MGWTAYAGIGDGTRGVVWPQSVAMKIAGHKNWIDLSARRDRV
jgi:hypothetical protein